MEDIRFTCRKCGAHKLVIRHEYVVTSQWEERVYCQCQARNGEIAAERVLQRETRIAEEGELDDTHHWRADAQDSERGEPQEIASEAECPACVAAADADDWEIDDEDDEIDESSEIYAVLCWRCRREIEFGWSHPDRGGRIWPIECADFNPWKSWPEPRFRESWQKKGWLRPAMDA